MKIRTLFLPIIFLASCAGAKEKQYTGSTPAGPSARIFLNIPLADSVDFIRWKLTLQGERYSLHCNYGIGKPNTAGFYNGGKNVTLTGDYRKAGNIIRLRSNENDLSLVELNNDLLHLLDGNDRMLVGGGGWSYTLSNLSPEMTNECSVRTTTPVLKDSIAFVGRTPCGIPGLIGPGRECYKLKWSLILYSDRDKGTPTTYRVRGTAWDHDAGRTGRWEIVHGKDGRFTYRLLNPEGKDFLHLLRLDDSLLAFVDTQGRLLVGNEDFSYTLNVK